MKKMNLINNYRISEPEEKKLSENYKPLSFKENFILKDNFLGLLADDNYIDKSLLLNDLF